MSKGSIYRFINLFGEKQYCRKLKIELITISGEKENLKNIESDVLDVLNDKAFDGICTFEAILRSE